MKNELITLFNAMLQIETKGDSTIKMSDCLKYLKGLIDKQEEQENAKDDADIKQS